MKPSAILRLRTLAAVKGARIVGDAVLRLLGHSDATLRALGQARAALIEEYGEAAVKSAEVELDRKSAGGQT